MLVSLIIHPASRHAGALRHELIAIGKAVAGIENARILDNLRRSGLNTRDLAEISAPDDPVERLNLTAPAEPAGAVSIGFMIGAVELLDAGPNRTRQTLLLRQAYRSNSVACVATK